jgi:LmbE family N-acetylglucosaminyl deacetylase
LTKEDVKLYSFKNRDLSKAKILIVSPHPDDAEIAAFGLYSSYNNSFITTITAGDASGVGSGYFKYDELFQGDLHAHNIKKGQIRSWNSITVPLLGNLKSDQVLNLGNFDGTLEAMYLNPNKDVIPEHIDERNMDIFRNYNIPSLDSLLTAGNNWISLVENLKLVLKKVQPDIIVIPYPLIDTHKDHQYATLAMFEAIKALKIHNVDLFMYTNHFLNELYPFGSAGSVVSLPPNMNLEIYFRSLYSFNLNFEQQRNKVFALDAMNDLRMDTEWINWESLFLESLKTLNRQILAKEKSYFRRAVRCNELFFVIPVEDIYNKDKMESIFGR